MKVQELQGRTSKIDCVLCGQRAQICQHHETLAPNKLITFRVLFFHLDPQADHLILANVVHTAILVLLISFWSSC